jgi:hypothetical protein
MGPRTRDQGCSSSRFVVDNVIQVCSSDTRVCREIWRLLCRLHEFHYVQFVVDCVTEVSETTVNVCREVWGHVQLYHFYCVRFVVVSECRPLISTVRCGQDLKIFAVWANILRSCWVLDKEQNIIINHSCKRIAVFWKVAPCCHVYIGRRFRCALLPLASLQWYDCGVRLHDTASQKTARITLVFVRTWNFAINVYAFIEWNCGFKLTFEPQYVQFPQASTWGHHKVSKLSTVTYLPTFK